jgi:hypothetical protein
MLRVYNFLLSNALKAQQFTSPGFLCLGDADIDVDADAYTKKQGHNK